MTLDASTAGFDEAAYLEANPDIRQALAEGVFKSGLEHWVRHGRQEGRTPGPARPAPAAVTTSFDEAAYLEANPDIAEAVQAGRVKSGFAHWTQSGRVEGRLAPPGYTEGDALDADWYLSSYHMARHDIAGGRAKDAADHYARLGRFRGYLPNRFVERPNNPAGHGSAFGGFWLDQGNAADLIDGRLELGLITPDQAELLRFWREHGYVILRNALAPELVDRAATALRSAYDGEVEGLRFECPSIGGYHPVPWDKAVCEKPAKALDLHWWSEDIRNLIFAPPVRGFLELVFERRVLASQSLTFLLGSAQGYHQDSLYVPYSLPTQFAASWIALEDVQVGGGELTYFPGSHRLPETLFGRQYKTLWDAQRMLRRNSLRDEMANYSDNLADASRKAGLEDSKFMARRGDVLLWHADLAHGGLPISTAATRASVVTHYCPKEVASLTFERGRTAMREHGGTSWYATGYYAA